VDWFQLPRNSGFIRIEQFCAQTSKEVQVAVNRLVVEQGCKQLILDLRGNQGGSLLAACEISSLFLPRKSVVCNLRDSQHHDLALNTGPSLFHSSLYHIPDLEISILSDSETASAAEVMMACLKSYYGNKISLYGLSNTYGKGSSQAVFRLQDGSGMVITKFSVLSPNGESFNSKGIQQNKNKLLSLAKILELKGQIELQKALAAAP